MKWVERSAGLSLRISAACLAVCLVNGCGSREPEEVSLGVSGATPSAKHRDEDAGGPRSIATSTPDTTSDAADATATEEAASPDVPAPNEHEATNTRDASAPEGEAQTASPEVDFEQSAPLPSSAQDGGAEPSILADDAAARNIDIDIDVPSRLLDVGGSVEIRRTSFTDLPHQASVAVERLNLEPEVHNIVAATQGADLLTVVFNDPQGKLVDAQFHEPACPQLRPVRGAAVLNVPADFQSIQEAIDAASPGDTVFVEAGTYHENLKLAPNVLLLGAGPDLTTLDGKGEGADLVDVTNAYGSAVMGFNFVNVTSDNGCARPDDEFACAGDWYGAPIYGDGHADELPQEYLDCHPTTTFISGNRFEQNVYGLMLYFRVHALVSDNWFEANDHGLVVNHGGDGVLFAEHNTFVNNADVALASSSVHVFASFNTFADNLACRTDYVVNGAFECNLFIGSETCDLVPSDAAAGNVVCDDQCQQSQADLAQSCTPDYSGD